MKKRLCPLCLEWKPDIRKSHIIPAWFYRDVLGGANQGVNVDGSQCDDIRLPLLCGACEEQLSQKADGPIANFYRQYLNNADNRSFSYDAHLFKFAVSILWRILVWKRVDSRPPHDPLLNDLSVIEYEEAMRLFLHEEKQWKLNKFSQHITLLHPKIINSQWLAIPLLLRITKTTVMKDVNLLANLAQKLDPTCVYKTNKVHINDSLVLMCQMGSFLFFGVASTQKKWEKSKLRIGGDAFKLKENHLSCEMFFCLLHYHIELLLKWSANAVEHADNSDASPLIELLLGYFIQYCIEERIIYRD